jgi:hypothetical protein
MENYAVFNIKQPDDIPVKDYNRCLLTDIVQQLQKWGIKCGQVKYGSFCVFAICALSGKEVSVVLYEFELIANSIFQSSIECVNHMPLWKRLFKTYSPNAGEHLQKVCEVLRGIINGDSRFVDVRWMTCEKWRKIFLGHDVIETQ